MKMKKEDSKGQVVLYKNQVEVRLVKDTLWLSLNQMADLFERDKSVISRHCTGIVKVDTSKSIIYNHQKQGGVQWF